MIDYDKYCHCIMCSRNLLIERIANGKIERAIDNDYDTISYRLNDSSIMRVVVCKPCKPTVTDAHNDMIMTKVFKGWVKEIEDNPTKFTAESKQAYLDKYSKLAIKHKES